MKKDIIICGVGGQGIVSIAATIGYAAVESGLKFKQSEVHGMSQRGGEVQSHFRLSDSEIHSDLIPKGKADLIISVEPMEALRYIPYLSKEGWIITNTKPFINFAKYPDINKLMDSIDAFPRHIALNADETARNIGAPKSANMVILGAASMLLEMDFSELENGIKLLFKNKSDDVIQSNISALRAGREYAIECLK